MKDRSDSRAAHRNHAFVPVPPVAGPAQIAEYHGPSEDAPDAQLEPREPVGVAYLDPTSCPRTVDVPPRYQSRWVGTAPPDVPPLSVSAAVTAGHEWMHDRYVGHRPGVVEGSSRAVDAYIRQKPESVWILTQRAALDQRQTDDVSLCHGDVVGEVAATRACRRVRSASSHWRRIPARRTAASCRTAHPAARARAHRPTICSTHRHLCRTTAQKVTR